MAVENVGVKDILIINRKEMKVVITSQGNDSQSIVDARFGRCAYFAIYDIESRTLTFKKNPNKEVEEGAGPASVSFVANLGASKIVSGEFGAKIRTLLNDLKIQMIIMKQEKTIQEIVELLTFKK